MQSLSHLNSWHSNWKDLRVTVVGLGVTGFSVADTLAELGSDVLVLAEKADAEYLDILDVLGVKHLVGEAAAGVPPELDALPPDLIVTSPGVTPDAPIIQWATKKGIPVWVDIELAWRLRDKNPRVADWIALSGTNGKTTTTQLTTAMLSASGLRAAACGNIGVPVLDCIRDPDGFDVLVLELSSFQLHYLGEISPHSSALLNVDFDHLDWHGSFEAYLQAKGKVFSNTRHAAIYNTADANTRKVLEEAEVVEDCRAIGFSLGSPGLSEIGYVEDILVDRAFIEERSHSALEVATVDEISKIGLVTPHLLANVAAATALARSYGVSPQDIREALSSFKLDAHRIELIAEHEGIRWVDDSKATNPHATAASLSSFESVIWIVGGLLKGVDIEPLVKRFKGKLRGAVVIGADRTEVMNALASAASDVPVIEISVADNHQVMPHAVTAAAQLASRGDTVLLAPASASMDQFKDYADRGRQFAAAVNRLIGGEL